MHELMKEPFGANTRRVKLSGFPQQTNGELMKRQQMNVQQSAPVFDAEQPKETTPKRIGGNDNREGSQRIGRFQSLDGVDEGQFESGVKWAGDKTQHRDVGSREA